MYNAINKQNKRQTKYKKRTFFNKKLIKTSEEQNPEVKELDNRSNQEEQIPTQIPEESKKGGALPQNIVDTARSEVDTKQLNDPQIPMKDNASGANTNTSTIDAKKNSSTIDNLDNSNTLEMSLETTLINDNITSPVDPLIQKTVNNIQPQEPYNHEPLQRNDSQNINNTFNTVQSHQVLNSNPPKTTEQLQPKNSQLVTPRRISTGVTLGVSIVTTGLIATAMSRFAKLPIVLSVSSTALVGTLFLFSTASSYIYSDKADRAQYNPKQNINHAVTAVYTATFETAMLKSYTNLTAIGVFLTNATLLKCFITTSVITSAGLVAADRISEIRRN